MASLNKFRSKNVVKALVGMRIGPKRSVVSVRDILLPRKHSNKNKSVLQIPALLELSRSTVSGVVVKCLGGTTAHPQS
jgi:hypothetical protein